MAPMALTITAGNPSGHLAGNGFLWQTGAYGWVYTSSAMAHMPTPDRLPHQSGVEVQVGALEPGKYVTEYWDCFEGKVVTTETKELAPGQALALHFPPFICNMAFKIKKQK